MWCPERWAGILWDLKKNPVSWDSMLEEGSWFSGARRGQTSSLRRGAARGGVRWKSQHCQKVLIKTFVPEPISFFFPILICVWTLWTFCACEYLGRIFGRGYVTNVPQCFQFCSTVLVLMFLFTFIQCYSVVSRDSKDHKFFSCWLLQGLVVWPRLGDLFVSQNPRGICVSHSPE